MIPTGHVSSLMPSPAEWEQARAETAELDVELTVKQVTDVVPGDALCARGSVRLVADWPELFPGTGYVLIPVEDRVVPDPLEFTAGRHVITWRGRTVNYGLARCSMCQTWGTRDHELDGPECRMLVHDRETARMADTTPEDL